MAVAQQLSNGDIYFPSEFSGSEAWWRGLWFSLNIDIECIGETPNNVVDVEMERFRLYNSNLQKSGSSNVSDDTSFQCDGFGNFQGSRQLYTSNPLNVIGANWMSISGVGEWDRTTFLPLNQTATDLQESCGGVRAYQSIDDGISSGHCLVFTLPLEIDVERRGSTTENFKYVFYKRIIVDLEANIDDGDARIASVTGLQIDLSVGVQNQEFGELDINVDRAVVPYNNTTEREVVHLDYRVKSTE